VVTHSAPGTGARSVPGLAQVCALIQARLGIEIRHPDRADNRLRLEGVRTSAGCADWAQLGRRLLDEPMTGAAWVAAITHLAVGETYFFRHRRQFDHLRTDILEPLIAERRRKSSPWLRLWSAACSTGEEAYSLAVLVRELVPDWERWNILIVGTDVNEDAIAWARTGRYREWSFREPVQGLKESCFTLDGAHFVVRDTIRSMVTFATHNLLDQIKEPWAQSFDVILCRNVILYFPAAAAATAVGHLRDALRPGGSLLVGPSDPWPDVFGDFELVSAREATSFRRAEKRLPVRQDGPRAGHHSAQPGANQQPTRGAGRAVPPPPPLDRPDVASCLRSARVAADAGLHDAAIEWCRRALELAPATAEAYFLLGSIHGEQLDSDRAIAMLRKAVYLEPTFALAHHGLGQQLHLAGDLRGARRSLGTAHRILSALPGDLAIGGGPDLTAAQALSATDMELSRT
jgi:chemotaxis protein methyltransferase CheR